MHGTFLYPLPLPSQLIACIIYCLIAHVYIFVSISSPGERLRGYSQDIYIMHLHENVHPMQVFFFFLQFLSWPRIVFILRLLDANHLTSLHRSITPYMSTIKSATEILNAEIEICSPQMAKMQSRSCLLQSF